MNLIFNSANFNSALRVSAGKTKEYFLSLGRLACNAANFVGQNHPTMLAFVHPVDEP